MSRGSNDKFKGNAPPTRFEYGIETIQEASGNGMIIRVPKRQRRKENTWGLRESPNKAAQVPEKRSDNFIDYLWPYILNIFCFYKSRRPGSGPDKCTRYQGLCKQSLVHPVAKFTVINIVGSRNVHGSLAWLFSLSARKIHDLFTMLRPQQPLPRQMIWWQTLRAES